MKGAADQISADLDMSDVVALKPTDFKDLLPKLALKAGQEVKAGEPVFFDKDRPEIKFCSPVSGEIAEIRRGAKRKILEVLILADKETKHVDFGVNDPSSMNADEIRTRILESGCWPFITQRPYGTVASPGDTPKGIFISGFNSTPISADIDYVVHGQQKDFQTGIDALGKLCGNIQLGLNANSKPSDVFTQCKGVTINYFKGPHPAGNVGTQIHHISPINKDEVVWTVRPQDVLIIGRLFNEGKFDARRTIALAGPAVDNPKYFRTIIGAKLDGLFKSNVTNDNVRHISGNVYTGKKIEKDGFLGFYDDTVTVLEEGNKTDLFGWVTPGFGKFSVSRTFPAFMNPGKEYALDTNMHGEERAFVVTGEYERVFPFDIYPQFLLKAMITRNIEKMEALGAYEVVEEDFALPEVICTSKIPLQEIVGESLSYLKKEMGH